MDGSFAPEEAASQEDIGGGIGREKAHQPEHDDAHPRTAYRRCRRPSFPVVPVRYWLAAASVAALLLPGFSNLLYLESGKYGTAARGGSCTSGNEWLWIGSASALLLVPRLNASTSRGAPAAMATARPKLSLARLNGLWYAAALVGPCLWQPPGAASFVDWLEYFGAKAAWPGLLNFALVLLPAQRRSRLLEFYYFDASDEIATRTALLSMHTAVAWSTVLWLALHTVLITVAYLVRDHDTFWEKMLPLTKYITEGIVNFSGWCACVSISTHDICVSTSLYYYMLTPRVTNTLC